MSARRAGVVPSADNDYGLAAMDRGLERGLLRWAAVPGVPLALAGIPVADAHGADHVVAIVAGVLLALAFAVLAVVAPRGRGWWILAGLVLLSYWPCLAWAAFWFYPALMTLLFLAIGVVVRIDRSRRGTTA